MVIRSLIVEAENSHYYLTLSAAGKSEFRGLKTKRTNPTMLNTKRIEAPRMSEDTEVKSRI